MEGQMKQAAWLKGRRMQKFRGMLSRWEAGALSMAEAGELLGVSEIPVFELICCKSATLREKTISSISAAIDSD
jgi:hypothetical protein